MSALPEIPDAVRTVEQLLQWIHEAAGDARTPAARMRLAVAVMDRAVAIRDAQRSRIAGAGDIR